jgi:hypothetical protein
MAVSIVRSLQNVKVQNVHVDTSVLYYGLHISILGKVKAYMQQSDSNSVYENKT